MHLHHDLDIDVDKICKTFVAKHKRGGSKGESFTSRIQANGKQPRNDNVQPRLVGGGVGRSNFPQNSAAVLSVANLPL